MGDNVLYEHLHTVTMKVLFQIKTGQLGQYLESISPKYKVSQILYEYSPYPVFILMSYTEKDADNSFQVIMLSSP